MTAEFLILVLYHLSLGLESVYTNSVHTLIS